MARDLDSPQRRARARAGRIRSGIRTYIETLADILAAWQERDWESLGYDTWDDYLDGEYGQDRLGLNAELRTKALDELRLAGMSQRMIAATVGVSVGTVNRALSSGVQNETDDDLSAQVADSRGSSVKGSMDASPIGSANPPASRPSPPHPTDETGTSQPVRVPPHPGGPVESPSAPGVDVGVVDTAPPVTAVATDAPAVQGGVAPTVGGDTPLGSIDEAARGVIAMARDHAAVLVDNVQRSVRWIVAGVAAGAPQIVTRDMVAALRAAADELEGLLT